MKCEEIIQSASGWQIPGTPGMASFVLTAVWIYQAAVTSAWQSY